jgi:hypothetical protein
VKPLLLHLSLALCMLMQVVYGSTYRVGLALCVPLPMQEQSDDDDGQEHVCHHHHPASDHTQLPGHSHDCPHCVDVQMPDSTVPPPRLAGAGMDGSIAPFSLVPAAMVPCAMLPLVLESPRRAAHPPDRAASRDASGLRTTRLVI